MRFVQLTKHALLRIKVDDVLILAVDDADRPIPQRFEDAVCLEVLVERQAFSIGLAITV